MKIQRYLNGEPIGREALSVLSLVTPALEDAVRDVGNRAIADAWPSLQPKDGSVTGSGDEHAAEG